MEIVVVLVFAALIFGLCYVIDKVYHKIFRSMPQHKTGLSVRLNKRHALFGIIMSVLGISSVTTGVPDDKVLLIGGSVILLVGVGLIVYYLTYGIFYDVDSFILTTFGRKSKTYRFEDIVEQRLYTVQGGNVLIELYLTDGAVAGVQSTMEGTYPFLDHAFSAWCRQKGIAPETCDFHDPSQSKWFPMQEDI